VRTFRVVSVFVSTLGATGAGALGLCETLTRPTEMVPVKRRHRKLDGQQSNQQPAYGAASTADSFCRLEQHDQDSVN